MTVGILYAILVFLVLGFTLWFAVDETRFGQNLTYGASPRLMMCAYNRNLSEAGTQAEGSEKRAQDKREYQTSVEDKSGDREMSEDLNPVVKEGKSGDEVQSSGDIGHRRTTFEEGRQEYGAEACMEILDS